MLVFLGEEWEVEPDLKLRHELQATAESLTGSAYQQILTQYSGLEGPISTSLTDSPTIEEYYVKRPITTRIDNAEAVKAANEVIALTGGGRDVNTTYAILPAPGTAEVELRTCGFHEEYGSGEVFEPGPSVAVIMDTEERIGCNTSKTLTHEYAESVTDPDGLSGWNTGGAGENEIADLCNELSPGRLANGALVAWLWDDSKEMCEVEDTHPGSVPIGPYTQASHRTPSLEGATNVSPESEMIETSIYPCDQQARYHFEYGTSASYGTSTAESVVPAAWGAVKVSTTLTGLQHSTTYHWRVVVETGNGVADGVDHEFTVPYYAEVKGERASDVGLNEATLDGEVRPVGVETKYYFEYGTTTAYGSRTAEVSVGSGDDFVEVGASVTGLQPGIRYHYRLLATNSRGTTMGEDKEFETLGGKPVVLTEPIWTMGYTSAVLKGSVYGKGYPTKYYFEYGTTSGYGQRTPERETGGPGDEEEKEPVEDLLPGTLYHYRIVATNSYGTSYGEDKSFKTPREPLVETAAPETVGYDNATLSAMIDPNGTSTHYYFEYGPTQAYGERTTESTAISGTSDVHAAQAVDFLAEHTTYHFRVVASTYYGTTYGADRTFSTGTKPSVQTGAAQAVGTEEATLSGTIDPHGTEVTYYFEYGATSEYGTSTTPVSAGAGEADVQAATTIAGLTPDATYRYRIVAVYGSVKQYGSEATFTTAALPQLINTVGPQTPAGGLVPASPLLQPGQAPSSPLVRNAHQSASRWREGNRLARLSRAFLPIGTTFSFSLNERAIVRFAFTRLPTPAAARGCTAGIHKSAKGTTCDAVAARTLSFTGHSGTNSLMFAGRVSRTGRLKPGRYALTIIATDSTGQRSTPVSLVFTIVK